MVEPVMQNEGVIRLAVFAGILLAMMGYEALAPRRALTLARARRWFANLGIVAINTLVLRLLFPILAVGTAVAAESRGLGLFNLLPWPAWLEVLAGVLLLDLIIYWQHRIFHAVPLFWRLHKMHHADLDFDVTTALRFHPVEIVISMLLKIGFVWLLGAPALAVLIFEVLLNGTSMFNHANIRLPLALDRMLRLVVVTPDMHRVHHSSTRSETDSNFGFNLPWWDRLFASYKAQPDLGHAGMEIGLPEYRGTDCASLPWMLMLPFRPQADRT